MARYRKMETYQTVAWYYYSAVTLEADIMERLSLDGRPYDFVHLPLAALGRESLEADIIVPLRRFISLYSFVTLCLLYLQFGSVLFPVR